MTTLAKESTAATLVLDQRVARDGVRSLYRRGDGRAGLRSGKPLRLSTALRDACESQAVALIPKSLSDALPAALLPLGEKVARRAG